jgi:hypothetical protein
MLLDEVKWVELNVIDSLLQAGGIIHSDTGGASVRKLSSSDKCVFLATAQ